MSLWKKPNLMHSNLHNTFHNNETLFTPRKEKRYSAIELACQNEVIRLQMSFSGLIWCVDTSSRGKETSSVCGLGSWLILYKVRSDLIWTVLGCRLSVRLDACVCVCSGFCNHVQITERQKVINIKANLLAVFGQQGDELLQGLGGFTHKLTLAVEHLALANCNNDNNDKLWVIWTSMFSGFCVSACMCVKGLNQKCQMHPHLWSRFMDPISCFTFISKHVCRSKENTEMKGCAFCLCQF